MPTTTDSALVAQLNNRLRCRGIGGSIVLAPGVAQLDVNSVHGILSEVRAFADFGDDNDPYGEHDLGRLAVGAHEVIWKIDYFDPTMTHGSVNPANEAVTRRVLTIMLADEY